MEDDSGQVLGRGEGFILGGRGTGRTDGDM